MLFRKLYIERVPQKKGPQENWYLIIRTIEDVIEYSKIEAELTIKALLCLKDSVTKSHLEGPREVILNTMMHVKAHSLKGDETISPLDLVQELVSGKARTMLQFILKDEEVLVQQKGGYCTYAGFKDTWGCKVLQEVEKEGCAFPIDILPIDTDLLFIENGERVPVDFENQVDKIVGVDWNSGKWEYLKEDKKRVDFTKKVRYKLNNLKLIDKDFVIQMIIKAKCIAFESQLTDDFQIDDMFKLFVKLKGKRLIIKTGYKEKIENHVLFPECNKLHEIEFI